MELLIKSLLLGASFIASVSAQVSVTCKTGAHVIVVRGSTEAPGFGILKTVSDQIVATVHDSDEIAVPYPASIFPPEPLYIDSEPEGAGNLTILIKQYGDACPDGKMALLGYSQGAHVIGDALIGADYEKFPAFKTTPGIEQKYIDQILAIVMMGDPANVAGQPFLVGNSTHSGVFPRNNTDKWASTGLVPKIKSFCDANDEFCDSGKSLAVHEGYIPEYGSQMVKHVVDAFFFYQVNHPNSTSNGTSAGTGYGNESSTGLGSSSSAASGMGGIGGGASATSAMGSLSAQATASSTATGAGGGTAATSAASASSTAVATSSALRSYAISSTCIGFLGMVMALSL